MAAAEGKNLDPCLVPRTHKRQSFHAPKTPFSRKKGQQIKKQRLLRHFLTVVTTIIMIMTILNDIMTVIFISIIVSVIALVNAGNDEFAIMIDFLKYVWWPKIGPDLKHGGFSEICPVLSDLALTLSPSLLYTHTLLLAVATVATVAGECQFL